MDITYIPMAKGFVYLAAVLDWFSRRVSITMEAAFRRKLPAAQARTRTRRDRYVMSRIARTSNPIAGSLRRRFQAGHGGAWPAAAHSPGSGLLNAPSANCRRRPAVSAALSRLVFPRFQCLPLPACPLMARAKSS
jgi:hypothetical protein